MIKNNLMLKYVHANGDPTAKGVKLGLRFKIVSFWQSKDFAKSLIRFARTKRFFYMKTSDKLLEILKIAVDNGYLKDNFEIDHEYFIGQIKWNWPQRFSEYELLFSHDFAESFWGKNITDYPQIPQHLHYWQYHIQQAVISDDPINYYWENRPLK